MKINAVNRRGLFALLAGATTLPFFGRAATIEPTVRSHTMWYPPSHLMSASDLRAEWALPDPEVHGNIWGASDSDINVTPGRRTT